MSKGFWGVIIAITIVFVGIFALNGNKSDDSGSTSDSKATTNHTVGAGTTGVTLVEYGDFQCPYCGQYYPVLKEVKAKYGDQITFQFRHFPLVSIHPNAFAASRAAEAASYQGKFWEMHDKLFESQAQWSSVSDPGNVFAQYAQQLGLDVNKFKTDSASSKANNAINADKAAGEKLKVDSTPTFYLDGKKITVGVDVEDFSKQIDAAIAKKKTSSQQPATSSN